MLFYEIQELLQLIRLGLSLAILDIHEFRHLRMLKDRVAATDPRQAKAKSLNQGDHVSEAKVLSPYQGFLYLLLVCEAA